MSPLMKGFAGTQAGTCKLQIHILHDPSSLATQLKPNPAAAGRRSISSEKIAVTHVVHVSRRSAKESATKKEPAMCGPEV